METQSSNTQGPQHTLTYSVGWPEYDMLVRNLAFRLEDVKVIKKIIGIGRGGLPIAVHLSHLLKIEMLHSWPIKSVVTSFPHEVLVVDDISDTGKTLVSFQDRGCQIATLFMKPQTIVIPNFYVKTVPNDTWVIFPWEV